MPAKRDIFRKSKTHARAVARRLSRLRNPQTGFAYAQWWRTRKLAIEQDSPPCGFLRSELAVLTVSGLDRFCEDGRVRVEHNLSGGDDEGEKCVGPRSADPVGHKRFWPGGAQV